MPNILSLWPLLVFIPLFAIGNMIRGGWFFGLTFPNPKPWWKKSDLLYTLITLVALALPFSRAPAARALAARAIGGALGNHAGAAGGLGTYVGGYLNGYYSDGGVKQDHPNPENPVIDFLLKPFAKHQQLYCWLGMFLRGVEWAACIAIGLFLANLLVPLGTQVYLGTIGYMLMPIGFTISKRLASPSNAWLYGEGINGAIVGIFWGLAFI